MGVGPLGVPRLIAYNTYVVLAPAVSWAVLRAFVTGRGRIIACAAFAMTNVFGIGAIERTLERLFVGAHFMMPAGTLLFVVWLILYARPAAVAEPATQTA